MVVASALKPSPADAGAADVPGIGNHETAALMQGAKGPALLGDGRMREPGQPLFSRFFEFGVFARDEFGRRLDMGTAPARFALLQVFF